MSAREGNLGLNTEPLADARPRQKVMLLFAITGVGTLLLSQAAYTQVFSYPLLSRSTEYGITNVTIAYVNPLDEFFPIFLASGISMSAYGFWKSRNLLALHKRMTARTFGIGVVLMVLSLVNATHPLNIGINDYYYYGFPVPWLFHVLVDLPPPHSVWFPSPFATIDDSLFWTVVAYLGLWLGNRIRLGPSNRHRYLSNNQVQASPSLRSGGRSVSPICWQDDVASMTPMLPTAQ
jgi:hypothetical protein